MHNARSILATALMAMGIVACGKPLSSVATRDALKGDAVTGVGTRVGTKSGDPETSFTQTSGVIVASTLRGRAPVPSEASSCAEGMILVEGNYCPVVEHTCLEWLDPPSDRYAHFRCARYQKPATCKGERLRKRFCIDQNERTPEGSSLPMNKQSWTSATRVCEANGARLCKTSEWQFACEGEEMRPYPYGWERDSAACNVDVMNGLGKVGGLVDHRTPASAHPRCVSAFGVHDMAGNVDEWATTDGAAKGQREVMKGSWWLPGRHACRAFQGGHGANYGGTESGVRCCSDAPAPGAEARSASSAP